MEQDDARLIDLVLTGDSAAFSLLVRRYQDRLFTALVHIASSRDEAEDVAQEAFIQAYLKLSSFARNSSFYTWLYRIAFNTAISRRRRKRGKRRFIMRRPPYRGRGRAASAECLSTALRICGNECSFG